MAIRGTTRVREIGRGSTDEQLAKLRKVITELSAKEVRIGFLEGKGGDDIHETDGHGELTVAAIAEIQEFGAEIQMEARQQTIYKSVHTKTTYDEDGIVIHSAGEFKNGGRFVKAKKANFSSTHDVGAHVIVIPARPAFRNTMSVERHPIEQAAVRLAKAAVGDKITAGQVHEQIGAFVEGKVKRTIQKGVAPANAPSTIAKKGSAKPLIDTGQMVQSVRYGVYPRKGK